MRVLLAFDKFKDSMSAAEACTAAASALHSNHPEWTIDSCPLSDGGEGFATILTSAAKGEPHRVRVIGPRGVPVDASFGLVEAKAVPETIRTQLNVQDDARIALIEMAAASGLALLSLGERDVWQTTTYGTGELIRAAAIRGATTIVLGVGGSATNDLGLGALTALGVTLRTTDHQPASPAPANWHRVASLAGAIAPLPPVFIACDVTNPLLGPRGAAAVYGPQKGLQPEDIGRLDHESARMALLLCNHFQQPDSIMDVPGAGAAGGIAFGLQAALNARLLPGFEFVKQWLDLETRIQAADIVITGEGRFDESSLTGKGPGAIAARALTQGKRVHVFAGAVMREESVGGLSLHAITPVGEKLERALREGSKNLARVVQQVFG
jgi:glycerate kinase